MTDPTTRSREAGAIQLALRISGAALAVAGVLGVFLGSCWASETLGWLSYSAPGRALEIFVPFLPILCIALGAWLLVESRNWRS